jgi:hypothetical protein
VQKSGFVRVPSLPRTFQKLPYKEPSRILQKVLEMEHHGMSWNIMECHGTSWNVMEHHGIPWNDMEGYGILKNLVEHSGILYCTY